MTALSLTLSAFMTNTTLIEERKAATSSDQLGERVVQAFRKSSSSEYASMFPSSSEFTGMMKASSEIYGTHLADAQSEFTQNYKEKLVPAVKEAFDQIVKEGKEQGIDWNNAQYRGIEIGDRSSEKFAPVPVTIIFTSNGMEHKLVLDRALVINGMWNVSQFIRLI